MKLCILSLAISTAVFAQSTVTTYTTDLLNGGQSVTSVSGSTDHTQAQIARSINGDVVPLEAHQQKVISSDSNGSVVENIVRRYDPTGQLQSTERTVTETHKLPGGGSTVSATTYRSDINGGEQLAERRTTETRVSGLTTTTETVVGQPGINGTLQTTEKHSDVTVSSPDKKSSTTTEAVYRNASDGEFREADRKVTVQSQLPDRTVTDTTDYGPGVNNGSLQFQERRVTTSVTAPGGTQSTTVDVYAPSADGHVQDADAPPQLKQQQVITRTKNADGSVVETFSVREPSVSDATHLGPLHQVNQIVCTGDCATGAPVVIAPPKQ